MKSKNFEFLKQEKFDEYYLIISGIEEKFDSGKDLFNGVAEFLLVILNDVIVKSGESKKLGLNDAITTFRKIILEQNHKEDTNDFDKSIWNALKYIQISRNAVTHYGLEKYKSDASAIDKIVFLRAIHIILQFILIEYYERDFKIQNFDEPFYYESLGLNGLIEKTKKFEFDNGEINITAISIGDLVLDPERFFLIPEYQRNYSWGKEDCEELLQDIDNKKNNIEKVYFGSIAAIINIDEARDDNKKINVKIIDGQQRITTSLIFFIAVNNILRDHIDNEGSEVIIPHYIKQGIDNNKRINEKFFSLTMSRDSNLEFQTLNKLLEVNGLIDIKNDPKYFDLKTTNVYSNFSVILEYLSKKDDDDLILMLDYYYTNFVVSFVKFTQDSSNEMEIFENLNSKGMELSTYDIIKNHLYNLVEPSIFVSESKQIVEVFNKYMKFDAKLTKNLRLDQINKKYDDYFYNAIRYLYIRNWNADSASKPKMKSISKNKKSILKYFKMYLGSNKKSVTEFTELCKKLGKYLNIYSDIQLISKDALPPKSDWKYEAIDSLINLSEKEMTLFAFYFYDLFGRGWDVEKTELILNDKYKDVLKKSFFEIERWILFLLQCNGTGQSLTSKYIDLINFIDCKQKFYPGDNDEFLNQIPMLIRNFVASNLSSEDQKMISKYNLTTISSDCKIPNSEIIKNSLINDSIKGNHISMAFLRRLEEWVGNRNIKKPDHKIVYLKKSTIEHIMPQTLTSEWRDELVSQLPENGASMGEKRSKIDMDHDKYLNYIGNLLILSDSSNSSISNESFNKKQDFYIRENVSLVNQDFSYKDGIERKLSNIKIWNFETIQERTKGLTERLLQIYEIE